MKYFIDGGAHHGESVRLFRARHPDASAFKVVSFEPNPQAIQTFAAGDLADVEFHSSAIWIENGELPLHHHPGDYGLSLHLDMSQVTPSTTRVPCIDFSKWMLNRFAQADHVILKLDIEGSEYEVLEKMIADGSIGLVSRLYIEWHMQFRSSITQERHDALVAALASHEIVWSEWDAMVPEAIL